MATTAAKKGDEQKEIPVPQIGDEILAEKIRKACDDLDALDVKAQDITSKRAEVIARMEAVGLDKDAFRYVRALSKKGETDFAVLDLTTAICRKALQIPMQVDWTK